MEVNWIYFMEVTRCPLVFLETVSMIWVDWPFYLWLGKTSIVTMFLRLSLFVTLKWSCCDNAKRTGLTHHCPRSLIRCFSCKKCPFVCPLLLLLTCLCPLPLSFFLILFLYSSFSFSSPHVMTPLQSSQESSSPLLLLSSSAPALIFNLSFTPSPPPLSSHHSTSSLHLPSSIPVTGGP